MRMGDWEARMFENGPGGGQTPGPDSREPYPLFLPLKPVGMFPFYFNLNKTANHR